MLCSPGARSATVAITCYSSLLWLLPASSPDCDSFVFSAAWSNYFYSFPTTIDRLSQPVATITKVAYGLECLWEQWNARRDVTVIPPALEITDSVGTTLATRVSSRRDETSTIETQINRRLDNAALNQVTVPLAEKDFFCSNDFFQSRRSLS